jgi:diguanylate cyclase (GGDEF)-like protein/PAS domain S-box-containing protein
MNITAPKDASPRHCVHTQRFVLSLAALFALGVVIAGGTLLNIAASLNEDAVTQSRFYTQRALDNRIATSKNYITSYAYWTAAYDHLTGEVDKRWAYNERNMGETLFSIDGYEGVFVVDQGQTRYAVVRGALTEQPMDSFFKAPLNDLVSAARTAPGATSMSRYGIFEGWPAIITAQLILPNDDRRDVDRDGASVLLFVDQLTPTKLARLGSDYDLPALTAVDNLADQSTGPRLALDQTGFSLSWEPRQPGNALLWSVVPAMSAVVLTLALLLLWFFRHALRASRQVDSSYARLQSTHQALEASEERFRAVAEAASDWIWETDEYNRLTYLSSRFATVTGFHNETWQGQPIELLLNCDTTPLKLWLHHLDGEQGLNNLRCSYRDHGGQQRYCRVAARPILRGSTLLGFRGTATDITDEVAAHAQIAHLSMHDALTGLCNRHKLTRFLDETLAKRDDPTPLTLLLLDLDNFKPINDSLGHPAGDAVLLEVAGRLRDSTRDGDLVARLGGDEFVIVLSAMHNVLEIDRFCQRLIDNVQRPVFYDEQPLHVGVSIGVVQSRQHDCDANELLRCADIALHEAKGDGKNTWRYFASAMNDQIQQRRQLEIDLRMAVKHQQFVLYYQPRYKVDGKEIVAVEALVRWEHPVEGLLAPDTFIPLAEQTDLIVPLGRWVLREACETARHWPERITVSVNLSPVQFSRSDVVRDVRDALMQSRLPASRLELEITENVMLNDIDGALSTMIGLKELGVRLNMDDFGTGYSSLGYLRTYPFDGIKIDKRFIANMGNSDKDRAVVQAIINLAKAMGLTVTAEGVETAQQLQCLGHDQCHEVQGFFLSRPVDRYGFERLLKLQGKLRGSQQAKLETIATR